MNWSDYPNFQAVEFQCNFTGKNEMRPEFLQILQDIRTDFRKPMIITSGYRDVTHPLEIDKDKRGEHTYGLACDIAIRGVGAMELLQIAIHHRIRRIGVSQKGRDRFIHLGAGDALAGFPEAIWTY